VLFSSSLLFKILSRQCAGARGNEAMASSFGAQRSENVDALFSRLVEKLVGVTVRAPSTPPRASPRFFPSSPPTAREKNHDAHL
jgi:hypothetical protein